jgi:hypothetical protein
VEPGPLSLHHWGGVAIWPRSGSLTTVSSCSFDAGCVTSCTGFLGVEMEMSGDLGHAGRSEHSGTLLGLVWRSCQ